MTKAFRHKTTGRYLAGFTKSGEADTVKAIDYALTWNFYERYRKANYHDFIVRHRDGLREFDEVEV